MIKKSLLLLAAAMCLLFVPVSCEEPEAPQQENQDDVKPGEDEKLEEDNKQEETPTELKAVKCTASIDGDHIFESRPLLTFVLDNPNAVEVEATLKVTINSDMKKSVETIQETVKIDPSSKKDVAITTTKDLDPGFYNAYIYLNGVTVRSLAFGVDPFDIVSAPDMQPDFHEFWNTALAQLPELVEGVTFTMTEDASKTSAKRKVYLVEMQSVPNGMEGEPVIVRGYYSEPQDGKKHPVLVHFFGWDGGSGDGAGAYSQWSSDYAEFSLPVRGQYDNRSASVGGGIKDNTDYAGKNWFAFNFGDKDSFYYRGAFMDCVQAVRFMATREVCDMNNLFLEGSSQGGALSYACAALSDYPVTAFAANVAFLGDYPDYFKIVSWPGNVAKENQGSMSDEEMYAFLSYFDTKNMATCINSSVIASSGLIDTTCPPHTNFAPFNNLPTEDKQMIVAPEMGHDYPAGWIQTSLQFFKERMK